MNLRRASAVLLGTAIFSATTCAVQTMAQTAPAACGPSPTTIQANLPNIFSEQQEQWLGDAEADMLEREYRPVKDPQQSAYLEKIGRRLLAALPATTLQFHFLLVDSSEVNGFSLAGGRVYITRKLVASAQTEDDVAGVIAHEMGHILTHQFAYEATADLKRLLNITSVGDRADVYAKFQLLDEARNRDKHATNPDSDSKQDQADRVAVYAAAAAGYDPKSYAEFWNRAFFVNGKTGGGFSDFFGITKPDEKRLRQLRKLVADLPPGCGASATASSVAFQKWRNDVVANQAGDEVAAIPSVSEVKLTPPLRVDVENIRFSRDGKYVMAQDESSITVATRDPLKTLFRFDAERALPAEFTPDSQNIVFHTAGLHVERWSIADHKLVNANEILVHEPCVQTVLVPDGRTLACIFWGDGTGFTLSLIDVATGSSLFEKKGWFTPSLFFTIMLMAHDRFGTPPVLVPSSFSSDGNTMILGPGEVKLAFDLRTRAPIKLNGALKTDVGNVYAFQGDDKVMGINGERPTESGIFSFPDGKRVQQMKLNFAGARPVTRGGFFLVPGPPGYGTGAADITTNKFRALSKSSALDVYDETVATEAGDGSLLMYPLGASDVKAGMTLKLPQSPLGPARWVSLSPDGRYLAFSAKTRSGIWEVASGRQVALLRGFNAGSWTKNGTLLAEFPEKDKVPHQIAEINLSATGPQVSTFPYKMEDSQHIESGRLLQWKGDNKKTYTLTAFSARDNAVQWTRTFAESQPGQTTNQTDDDLILSYPLQSAQAKNMLHADGNLQNEANAVKHKEAGRLIEVADPASGQSRLQVVIEVPTTYEGVNGVTRLGDQLYLASAENRTTVYSAKTGTQLRQIFGTVVCADPASERITVLNRRDELITYDRDGKELQHFNLGNTIRFAELREKGTQLTVLTADQKLRRFDIDNATTAAK